MSHNPSATADTNVELPPGADYFGAAFGISDEDCRRLLSRALAKGGDYADLFFQHSQSTAVVLEDGRVNRAFTGVALGVGVRVVWAEHVGYAFSQVLEMPDMLRAADAAAALAAAGAVPPPGAGLEVGTSPLEHGPNYYPMATTWPDAGVERRIELVRRVEELMRAADPRIIKTIVQLHDTSSRIMVVNSLGRKRADLRPRTALAASITAEQNGERQTNSYNAAARAGVEFFTEDVLREVALGAVERTMVLFEAQPVAAGEMPLVLAAGSAGILLHEAIGHGLEADMNRRNISTYSGRLGETVAGPLVTVVDDGTISGSHGAINFDDEGNDSQRTVLVQNGRLVSYLHDSQSAAHYGTDSTGSCRRQSYEYAPMPRMRATFMEPGPHTPEEIIASVRRGLYAEQFTNGQVDIGAGSFSFYVKGGRLIEDGRLTRPVKDINVVGNGPEVLGRITMVADDLALARGGFNCGKQGQSVPVSQGLPTVLVSSINVGGARE